MECVKVHFAPGTEPLAARSTLQRAVRGANRLERWRTLCGDFFAFAELPDALEEEEQAAELSEASDFEEAELPDASQELSDASELPENVMQEAETPENVIQESQSLAIPESPFFCVLLCPDMRRELLAEVSEAAARDNIMTRFTPLSPDAAEDFYREALDACRGVEAAAPEFAAACQHLAFLLSETGRGDEAEPLYREALESYRKLSEAREDIAETSYRLARVLYGAGRLKDAEKLYCDAMDIYKELSKRNGAYESPLAQTCQDLAICLEDAGRPDAAEWFYRNALERYRKLAERNPAAYAPRVAATCGNLAGLLHSAGRVREAAALYRVALETYVRLVQENPAKWEPELAFLYENLAAFESRRSASAGKALLQSAWTLYQKYPDLSGEAERVRAQIQEL